MITRILNDFMDGVYFIKDTYDYTAKYGSGLRSDFSELFDYAKNSINHFKYSSSGIVGIVNDFMTREKIFCEKLKNIDVKLDNFTSGLENELKNNFENRTYSYSRYSGANSGNNAGHSINTVINSSSYRKHHDNTNISSKIENEIARMYVGSEKTLDDISWHIEEKYGKYISSSTISKTARKHYSRKGKNFKNRCDAKKYHSNKKSKS